MTDDLLVRHLGNDRFEITTRNHYIVVDQPVADGGEDTAPTPTELFVAGLASCVAFYARRYLARHDLDPSGLEVACRYTIGGRPARVTDITIRLTPPPALPDSRREAFLAVASHCTVHNTLEEAPQVDIVLESGDHR